jgi:hypothetical protein
MPVGSGARYLSNLPSQPFDVNPGLFSQLTSKVVTTPINFAYPGPSSSRNVELPHAGILAEIRINFEGNVAGDVADASDDALWAYRLLRDVRLSGSGQTDLIACRGIDLHALRFIRAPALDRSSEFFVSGVDVDGNFRVTWVIPVAADMTSLVGALWAQSQASQLTLDMRFASLAELGLGAASAITGTVTITETWFDPPYHPDGSNRIVIPDLTRTHGIVCRDQNITAVGGTPTPLARQQAQLMRLLSYVDLGHATGVANPVDYQAVAPNVTSHAFEYGAIQTPLEYEPAWQLAAINAEHYGNALPKGYVALDLVRENSIRDTVVMPGITDPRWLTTVKAGATIAAGAHCHLVEEVLYVAA